MRRLRMLGVREWPHDSKIVELFCGRGNGLVALERLAFKNIIGVDISPRLLSEYYGRARCFVADCRQLPFANRTQDVVIVQGGLHHLAQFPEDLELVLSEVQRVLVEKGMFVVIEPWQTPFLGVVHAICQLRLARLLSPRVSALWRMIELERPTYEIWLKHPKTIMSLFARYFRPQFRRTAWGKLTFVGTS